MALIDGMEDHGMEGTLERYDKILASRRPRVLRMPSAPRFEGSPSTITIFCISPSGGVYHPSEGV